jgi:hypothetical protein
MDQSSEGGERRRRSTLEDPDDIEEEQEEVEEVELDEATKTSLALKALLADSGQDEDLINFEVETAKAKQARGSIGGGSLDADRDTGLPEEEFYEEGDDFR